MKEIKPHPIAELFPIMSAPEIAELRDDIKERGLVHDIILFEGKILDGRHRYEACQAAGVKPRFREFKGVSALDFAKSCNLNRRHLTPAQRAAIAVGLANMRQGERTDLKSAPCHRDDKVPASVPTSQAAAADEVGVSRGAVSRLSQVAKESPKTFAQVRDGKLSIAAAAEKLAEAAKDDKPILDESGHAVPHALKNFWARRGEVRKMLADITNIGSRLLEAQKAEDDLFLPVHVSTVVSDLQHAHMEVKAAQLYAVCTTCQGKLLKTCAHCKGRGFLTEQAYKLVPADLRAMREKADKARK